MKLALAFTVISLITFSNYQQQPVVPDSSKAKLENLKKLEDRLRRLDELPESSVDVKVKDEDATSLNLNLKVEQGADALTAAEACAINLKLDDDDVPDEYVEDKLEEVMLRKTDCGSLKGVVVMQVGVGKDYEVQQDYVYDAGDYKITVKKLFTYDRASIPRIVWPIIDKDSLGNVAPLIHDLLYRSGGVLPQDQVSPYRTFSRKETDKLFLEVMTKCSVKRFRRLAAYRAVRLGGQLAWKGK